MVVPLFLFGQQFGTAVTWMCLMGAEKGTEWIEKAQNMYHQACRECLLPILENFFFFQRSGPCEGPAAHRQLSAGSRSPHCLSFLQPARHVLSAGVELPCR